MSLAILRSTTAIAVIALGLGGFGTAHAQDTAQAETSTETQADENRGLATIVVTATRRETNVQDVPLSITAISGEALRDRGISNPRDLTSLAPSLMIDQGLSNGQTHVSIRGVASTDFGVGSLSPIATYIDDVYQAYQFGIGTQIYDLNRVEVLRGPQGTLFGKNTTGGALVYYSQTPTMENEGYFQASVGGGDFMQYSAEGALNTVLADNAALRVSGRFDRRDNYIDNLLDGSELGHYTNFSGRAQLRLEPTDTLTLNLKAFIVTNRGDGPVYISSYADGDGSECDSATFHDVYNSCVDGEAAPDSPSYDETNAESPTDENYDTYGLTFKLDQEFGDYTLTAITGYQQGDYGIVTNDDGIAGDLFHSQQSSETWQISQEVRLATPADAPLRAVLGLYAQHDEITADQGSGSTSLDPTLGFDYYAGSLVDQETETLAAFASATFDVTDQFSIIGGLRYSHDKKTTDYQALALFGFNYDTFDTRDFTEADLFFTNAIAHFPPNPDFGDVLEVDSVTDSWNRLTWDVTANWTPTEDLLFYAKASTGFRSGGAPTFVTQPGTFTRLDPEIVDAYEVGFKLEFADGLARLNGSVYMMDYKDMQVQTPKIPGPGLIITNAASSSIKGFELEFEAAPTQGLIIHASLGYNESEYDDYASPFGQLAGNTLPYAPSWTSSFGASYEMPLSDDLDLRLGTEWSYRSRIFFDPYMSASASDAGKLLGNLDVSLAGASGWQLTAYAQNVTNELVKGFQFQIGYVNPTVYAPRRTFGLRGSFTF